MTEGVGSVSVRCPACGAEAPPNPFCDQCGHDLTAGRTPMGLTHVARIGRSEEMDIFISHDSFQVGRHHADLFAAPDGALYLVDNNSTNGTTIDGVRLRPGVPHRVRLGSAVYFGSFLFNTALMHARSPGDRAQAPQPPGLTSGPPQPLPVLIEPPAASVSEPPRVGQVVVPVPVVQPSTLPVTPARARAGGIWAVVGVLVVALAAAATIYLVLR